MYLGDTMLAYLFVYFVFINAVAAVVCYADKQRSKRAQRRISEKTLFFLSVIGGSIGMYATMRTIHHKTRHNRFMLGIPLIIICQIAVAYLVLTKM